MLLLMTTRREATDLSVAVHIGEIHVESSRLAVIITEGQAQKALLIHTNLDEWSDIEKIVLLARDSVENHNPAFFFHHPHGIALTVRARYPNGLLESGAKQAGADFAMDGHRDKRETE